MIRKFYDLQATMSMGGGYSSTQIELWKAKEEMYDYLKAKIAEFYHNSAGEYDEENPVNKGDITDIGELALKAFGWI